MTKTPTSYTIFLHWNVGEIMKYLTTKQLAIEMNVTVRTVERWREKGTLLPQRRTKGGHSRYSKEQVCNLKKQKLLEQIGRREKNIDLPSS